MKSFSDLYIKRRNEKYLDSVEDYEYDSYGIATDTIIEKYDKELNELQVKCDRLAEEIAKKYKELGSYEEESIEHLIHEQLFYEEKIIRTQAYPNSLLEMKIIHLFKNVELNIKYLISVAYPKVDTKAFFRWESKKSFFDAKDINLSKIDGHIECLELRKLNNCIKHNGRISPDIQKIREFKYQSSIEYIQMQKFYDRIKPKIQSFVCELKNEIKKELYVFKDDRLDELVKECYERMDREDFDKLILKLKSKQV